MTTSIDFAQEGAGTAASVSVISAILGRAQASATIATIAKRTPVIITMIGGAAQKAQSSSSEPVVPPRKPYRFASSRRW